MALRKQSKRTIQHGLDNKTKFNIGNVRGAWEQYPTFGRLPEQWRKELTGLESAYYFVYSYKTPIAWWNGKDWFIPYVKYSTTTSHHQNIVTVAITVEGYFA